MWRLLVSCCLASGIALATSPAPPDPLEALASDLDRTLGQSGATRNLAALQSSLAGYAGSHESEFQDAALAWLVKHDACFTTEEAKSLFQAFHGPRIEARLSSAASQAEASRAQRALEAQDRLASLLALTELPTSALTARLSNPEAQQRFLSAGRLACESPCTGGCYLVWLVASRIEAASRSASSGISPRYFEQLYRLSRGSAR